MSSMMTTPEDYKFFDFLAPYRWPGITKRTLALYRELVEHGDLHIETLLENALAFACQGQYQRIAENYRDFCDGSDAKKCVSQHRNNNIRTKKWMNTAKITGLANKTGLIRALVYSRASDQFYFFAVPHCAYQDRDQVEIVMDTSVGYREPLGIPRGKWTKCQVPSFERLATITHKQAAKQWLA